MRVRWVLFIFITAAAGLWAFGTGRDLANIRASQLEEAVRGLQSENLRLRDEIAGLQAFARDANRRLVAPSRAGGAADAANTANTVEQHLLDLARAQLGQGMTAERLAHVISAASDGRACDDTSETAAFIVKTEMSVSEFTSASLADNRVVITATGTATRDQTGQAHPWFDPKLPVRIEFTHISGATASAAGVLPFQHALVADDLEYRFLLAAGDTSFISVTAQRCAFP
ncbi:MAG: hypothetical protein O7A03_02540 [Alphaproteobacteria bacterium]|nr:hypothetical protein [Alphaproteobacteria bacterium]